MAPKPQKTPDWEGWCIALLIVIVLILALSGCTRKIYVPIETVHTETHLRERLQRDSIYVHDSVSFKEKGDTIQIEKWHTRWRERIRIDTCYIQKHDSVQIPYPIEKELKKWDRFKVDYGGYAVMGILLIVLIMTVRIVSKMRKL